MKHILEYNKYIDNEQLNEGNFISWLVRSRNFSDLYSLKSVTSLAKEVSNLQYKLDVYKLELRNDRVSKGLQPDRISQDELSKLQGMQTKVEDTKRKINIKYGDSEFLMYVSELVQTETRISNAQRLINLADENIQKQKFKEEYKIDRQQEGLIQTQLKLGNSYGGNFQEVDDLHQRKKKEERDELINNLNIKKLQLANKEIEARTKAKFDRQEPVDNQGNSDVNYDQSIY